MAVGLHIDTELHCGCRREYLQYIIGSQFCPDKHPWTTVHLFNPYHFELYAIRSTGET